jgi:hypothetical protein
MAKNLLVVLLVMFAPALFARPADADEARVALLDPDPNLLAAVSVALSPWGLRVVPAAGSPAPSDTTSATEGARAIARVEAARDVVWIHAAPGGQVSLWLYDAQTEQLTVRPLRQVPPYNEAAAAAVALTIKTLLRATRAATPEERTGGSPSAPEPTMPVGSQSSAAPSASTLSPSTTSARAEMWGSGSQETAHTIALTPSPPPMPVWRLDVAVATEAPTGTSAAVGLRTGVGGSFWPAKWGEHVGIGVDLRAGPRLDIATASFSGSFGDVVVGASARTRISTLALSIELGAGPSLHVTSLSGTGVGSVRTASIQRFDPALDVEVDGDIALGSRVRVGPLVRTSILLRNQRYVLQNDPVLRLPPVLFDFGGRVSLSLD